MNFEISSLDWEKGQGLIPAIVQDATSDQVLMLGYMDQEALSETLRSRRVTFFSRSKNRLWTKGESSGHFLNFVSVAKDCDNDALLIQANPQGPTCHLQRPSCFETNSPSSFGFLKELTQIIEARFKERPQGSYTTTLFEKGLNRIAQKVGEEGVEVVIAALGHDKNALKNEVADLIFHLLVLLKQTDTPLESVIETLQTRHTTQKGEKK